MQQVQRVDLACHTGVREPLHERGTQRHPRVGVCGWASDGWACDGWAAWVAAVVDVVDVQQAVTHFQEQTVKRALAHLGQRMSWQKKTWERKKCFEEENEGRDEAAKV